MNLLENSLIMSHLPSYPEPDLFHLDMHPDYPPPKHYHPYAPPPGYLHDPALADHPDDHLKHRPFDGRPDYPAPATAWADAATPRAWDGQPQRLALQPDAPVADLPYPAAEPPQPQHSPGPLYNLADYLQNQSPAPSPPTAYLATPPALPVPASFYPAASPDPHPYPRFAASLHDPACDPRFLSPAPAEPHPAASSLHEDVGISFADVYHDPAQRPVKQEQHPHTLAIGPAAVLHLHPPLYDSDSGEDEKSDSDDDLSYIVPSSSRARPMSLQLPHPERARPPNLRSSSTGTGPPVPVRADQFRSQRPTRTPAPEPVPNLTKKSRGRRVPTAAALYGGYPGTAQSTSASPLGGKNTRTYVCKVKDCGKCFARSEHLKRHVRSIHTNEKPHRCPHPGCNKEFSRHDNLCQHMRVHRNFSAPKDDLFEPF